MGNWLKQNWFPVVVIIAAVLIFGGILKLPGTTSGTAGQNQQTENNPSGNVCFGDTPTAAYSGVDFFVQSNSITGGTGYVKANGRAAVSSSSGSATSPVYGDQLSYWLSNTTYDCEPVTATAKCGKTDLQALCYQNATGVAFSVNSIKDGTLGTVETALSIGSDLDTGGSKNITIGANGNSKIKVVLNTVAKKSYLPFGGCVAVEYPNTLTQVDVTGDISEPCAYTWAYSVHSTSNTFKLYAVPKGFDAFATAQMKTFYVDMTAGSSNPSGNYYVTFQPAKYYLSDAGDVALGIQKDKNLDTTLTGQPYEAKLYLN